MTLIATALVLDPNGAPLAGLDAQLHVFSTSGASKIIAAGHTDDSGLLKLSSEWTPGAEYQPRLQLRLPRDGVFVEATENPSTFADGVCDFGAITFNPVLKILKLDPVVAPDADAIAPVSDGEDLDALKLQWETQKTLELQQLSQQLTAQKTIELQQLTQQLTAQKTLELQQLSQQLTQQLTAQKQAELQQLAQQMNAEKQAEAEAMTAQHAEALAGRDAEIAALGEQLAAAKSEHPPESTIEALAQTTADQLGRVRKSLRDGQSGLELGKVSLQLKVLPGQDSGRVALPQARQIEKVGAGALGSLELAFLPETARPGQRPQATAPRVLGYTEALARRKLAARGLGVEVLYQLVATAAEHGRVVLQRPAPEAPITEGAVVLIAVGRQEES